MKVCILGAHNRETRDTRLVSLLVDRVLAMDAGALTAGMTLEEQEGLGALLLTHRHYDHIRDLPLLAINTVDCGATLAVHALQDTITHLQSHLLDGALYPDFTCRPSPENPRLRLKPVEPLQEFMVQDYRVLPVPVPHGVPAVGYQVTSPQGRRLFYSGDVGPGLAQVWPHLDPHLLILETTLPDRMEEQAIQQGHMTPSLLRRELEPLVSGGLPVPPIIVVHMTPHWEREVREELDQVAHALSIEITPASEGMVLDL